MAYYLEGSLGYEEIRVLPSQEGSGSAHPLWLPFTRTSWASSKGTAGGRSGVLPASPV